MWQCKIKYKYPNKISELSKQYQVTAHVFVLNKFVSKKYVAVQSLRILEGNPKNIEEYIDSVKKDKYLELDVEGNILYYLYQFSKAEIKTSPILDLSSDLFFIKPLIFQSDGFCYLELASIAKKSLQEFIGRIKKHGEVANLSIYQEKIKTAFMLYLVPELTDNQKEVIKKAYTYGYYDMNRKINIDQLSKIMKKGKSTTHDSLRRAESKVIPWVVKNLF
ncbi:TPA: hypothetical protein HA241_06565 [Candidatus Woesearchaeota archaeon]|nr:hypothetical protein [Candidatus Woesearchaeota archaeon]